MFFALAIQNRNIDPSIAAIFYETWPILLIVLTGLLFRKDQRYSTTSSYIYALSALGFIGFSFIVFSQTGNILLNNFITIDTIFLFLAVTLAPLAAFGLRWGVDIADELTSEHHVHEEISFFGVIIANLIGNVITIPVILLAVIIRAETMTYMAFFYTLIGGFACLSIANILWRKVNLITRELGINALSYTTPLFSLMWLFLFSQVNVARVDYLVIGTAAIIIGNLLINFEAEVRFGFRALIIALWACGAFVYLRDDLLKMLPFASWVWPKGDVYLGALALSATVFILLLSFRVARLAGRTRDEDNAVFRLFQDVDLLVRRNLIDPSIRKYVLDVDGSQNPEALQTAYQRAKTSLSKAAANLGPDDQVRLADAEAQLNMIVHSRCHGIEFGELFALIIFGSITVFLALASRPEVSGWSGFLFEVFAALFSAVIIFLVVNVWDLQGDRAARVLQKLRDSDEYRVVFLDSRNRGFEQGTSIVIGLGITIAYVALLWQKWLP